MRDCCISHEVYAVPVVSFGFGAFPPTAAVLLSELGLIGVEVVQSSWLSVSSSFVEGFEGHIL